jgi:hypothetical protein
VKSPIKLPVVERKYLDNSILETMGRCPRLAFFNYVLNRAPRSESFPIQYGIAFHKYNDVLERLYLQWIVEEQKDLEEMKLIIHEAAVSVALQGWEDPPLEHTKSYLDRTRLVKACRLRFDEWMKEKVTGNVKVIGVEAGFTIPLPSGRIFAGRIDQVIQWNGRIWIRDWKTLGRKPKAGNFKRKFNPGHQFTGYKWAEQELSGRNVDGVIAYVVYNIKSTGPDFYPTLLNRSSGDVEHWMEWVEDAYDEWERRMETGSWPMRTSACDDYGGCYFKDACSTGSWYSIEQWLKQHTIESVWDPLNPDDEEGLPE